MEADEEVLYAYILIYIRTIMSVEKTNYFKFSWTVS